MANPIYNTTSITSLSGYINHAIEILQKKEDVTLIKEYSGGEPLIFNLKSSSSKNEDAIKKLKSLLPMAEKNTLTIKDYKDKLKSISLDIKETVSWPITAGNIMKSGEKIPFGYLAECLLQAAIVARFVDKRDKDQTINERDVIKFISQFVTKKSDSAAETAILEKLPSSKAVNKAFQYDAPNKNTKIGKDKVYVYYSLNDGAFRWLEKKVKTISSNSELMPFIKDAISYVNSGTCVEHSNYFYTNGRVDRIDIVSLGIMGQGQTKADIRTQYYEGWQGGKTGKKVEMHLNLSVKIRHVDQVGQLSGIDSQTYSRLVEYFGASLSSAQKKTIDENAMILMKNPGVINKTAQGKIYEIVYNQLQTATNVSKLLDGMQYFIAFTKKEAETLNVVDIGSGLKVYFVKNLDNVKKSYKNSRVKTEVTTGGGEGVTKQIKFIINNDVLFTISSRRTGGIYRNYISTGPLLRDILEGKL